MTGPGMSERSAHDAGSGYGSRCRVPSDSRGSNNSGGSIDSRGSSDSRVQGDRSGRDDSRSWGDSSGRSRRRAVRSLVPETLLLLLLLGTGWCLPAWSADTPALLDQAREASWDDDHEAAIRLYKQVIQADPVMRDSVSLGLATQLTWAGRLPEAIEEFQWALQRHPNRIDGWRTLALAQSWEGDTQGALESYRRIRELHPGDRDARLGEARMNSWLGRSSLALRQYRSLVEEYPEDREARLGLAQINNWRGDHRKAWAMYEAVVRSDSTTGGSGPWEGLALARNWAGRADLALQALDVPAQMGFDSESSAELRRSIEGQWLTRMENAWDWSIDSDDFSTTAIRLEAEAPIRYRGRARFGFLRERFDQPGRKAHTDLWLRASGDYRLATSWAVRGGLSVQADPPGGSDHTPLQGEVGGTWLPTDRWRLDLNYSRAAIFTYQKFPDRIEIDAVGAAVDFRPHYLTTLILAADRATYSDDNDRWSIRTWVRWWALQRPLRAWVMAGTHLMDFDRWTGNGYWAPQDYRAYYGRLELEQDPVRDVTLLAGCDGGYAKEGDASLSPYFSYYGGVVWRWGGLRLEGRGGHSDSDVETSRGYDRSYASVLAGVSF